MLTVHHIHKSFGLEPVLRDISFSINPGEKVGLVGANGCGKTTLLRIIMGLEPADGGSVQFTPPDLRVGYLPQGFAHRPDDTITSFIQRMEGDLDGLSARLERLAAELAAQPQRADLQRDYDDTLARLTLASETAGRGRSMLAAFGLGDFPPETPAAALSGGQKTRLALAGVLLSAPALLLLDEPTNHLDLEMMAWLENWLVAFRGAALIVSHDRAFLNHTAASILELDGLTHALRAYPGNYDAYLDQKAGERERQWQQYTDQQAEIVRLRRSAAAMRSDARYHPGGKTDPNNTDGFSIGFFANRSKEVIQKAKNIEKRVEHLLTDERVDKPARTWQMKIEFGDTPESARSVITTDELAIGYDDRPLLAGINLYLRYGERVALIGPNGCGKTTLLRTIAGMLPPVAGSVRLGGSVRPGYMTQEQEELNPALNPLETILQLHPGNLTEVRSFLSKFLFKGDDVFTPVRSLSYGERSRLSLACLVARGCNLLLLDEPINHLDIPARTRFEEALAAFEGTILAVVHDRYFIENFASHIWEVRGGRVLTYPYTPLTFAAAFQPPAGSYTTSHQEESSQ